MAVRNNHARPAKNYVIVNGVFFYPNEYETGISNTQMRSRAKIYLKTHIKNGGYIILNKTDNGEIEYTEYS